MKNYSCLIWYDTEKKQTYAVTAQDLVNCYKTRNAMTKKENYQCLRTIIQCDLDYINSVRRKFNLNNE